MTRDELIKALVQSSSITNKVYIRLDGYERYASADEVVVDEYGDIVIQEKQ